MIRIPLSDARVSQAYAVLKEEHAHADVDSLTFSEVFEHVHRCKVIADPNDSFCLTGWLEMTDEKYYTWFAIQFGDSCE
jgi:hypothetical protein